MAALPANNPTLLDLQQIMDPDGSIAEVTELLHQSNEVVSHMTWIEGNLTTGHQSTVRTGIPLPTWRKMYGGVLPTKSSTAVVTDAAGMMAAYAEIDVALADINNNSASWRMSEEKGHIEGFGQQLAETLFYGDSSINPERFTGLSPRYSSLTGAPNSENVIDGGSADTDNASIWLIVWSPDTAFGFVPKGSKIGLQISDLGEVTKENIDGNSGMAQVFRTYYRWDAGFALRDWRFVVRICNIDRSLLTPDASSGANLPNLMFEALERIPNFGIGRPAFYMDRSISTKLHQQRANGISNSSLEYDQVGGDHRELFQGFPIYRVDRLAVDEALVA